MIECLEEMLALDEQCPTYIILDAIDGCPLRSSVGSPREEVLDFINELVGHLPNVHMCVTSRPEADILAVLGPLAAHPVSLHNQSGQKQDIADYVRSFVDTDRRMRKWRDEDKDFVIKTLPEKADGMYVYLHMRKLVLMRNDAGFGGYLANWMFCGIAFHRVCGVQWRSYPTAWTRLTSGC
jgi:hypothetical protein